MDVRKLEETARELVAPGKGILAADESFGTIGKRFEAVGIESSEESRRAYREMLFTTEGIGEFLSGVILFDETIRQETSDGTLRPQALKRAGVIPGIKVDKSTVDMPLSPGEKFTQGLDGLGDRLAEYRELGARFTKWRAVITIGEGIPSESCIEANAEALALYAAFAQENGLVPIVEPEVLIDGDHSIEQCYEATDWTLHETFDELHDHGGEPPQERASGRARHRLPLRRPDGPAGDGPPQLHEHHERGPAVGALLLLRAGAARPAHGDLGRRHGEGQRGPAGLLPQGEDEQRRPLRQLLRGDGGPGGVAP